jgi:hypothetical protein
MSELKMILEAKKKEKKQTKMLPELHRLDDMIEDFVQKLEDKINGYKGDNPVFVKKAHQMLGDMSKEYSEFLAALRAIVNAVDRKGLVLPKEKSFGKVRDINSRKGQDEDPNAPPEDDEVEVGSPPEEKPKGVKEALLIEKKCKKKTKLAEVMGTRSRLKKIKIIKSNPNFKDKAFQKYQKTGFANVSDKELDRLWLKIHKAKI